MPWFRLCVVRVFNFQPTRDRRVRSALSLRYDAFQITSHDLVEQIHASSFDVFPAQNIQQRAILNKCPQLFFPFYQRELADVAAIQIQQIERIKYRTATTEHKLIKNNSAFKTEAHKLTIDHGVLYLQPGEIAIEFCHVALFIMKLYF